MILLQETCRGDSGPYRDCDVLRPGAGVCSIRGRQRLTHPCEDSLDDLQRRYDKHPDIVFRDIEGEMILVPIRRSTANLESIYTLNETAGRIWKLMDGHRTLAQIRDVLVEEYNVTPAAAQEDLLELVAYLEQIEALERA